MDKFKHKLWNLVNNSKDSIYWNDNGDAIIIQVRNFRQYLQSSGNIFSSSNYESFIRQLNLYGFRKKGGLKPCFGCENHIEHSTEYFHPFFKKDQPELLNEIKRKICPQKRRNRLQKNTEKISFIHVEQQDTQPNGDLVIEIYTADENDEPKLRENPGNDNVVVEFIDHGDLSLFGRDFEDLFHR